MIGTESEGCGARHTFYKMIRDGKNENQLLEIHWHKNGWGNGVV